MGQVRELGLCLRNRAFTNSKHEIRAKHPTRENPKQYQMTKILMIQTIHDSIRAYELSFGHLRIRIWDLFRISRFQFRI